MLSAKLLLLIWVVFFSGVVAATAEPKLEPVKIQIRWFHQFQFAGYYAAVHKGFYRKRGLDVTIVPGAPGRSPVNEVLSGRAQYGEANSELVYHFLKGEPLVALAAIFQHSPSAMITRADSGIKNPHHLIGKRLMMLGSTEDVDFLAMMANEGVAPDDVKIIPSSYNIQDLIDGTTDVFNGYLTNEPYYLREAGVEPYAILPVNYGVDFYSDILFTTRAELEKHPARVKAFREASLEGWEYAMSHKDEIVDVILAHYSQVKSRDYLKFEAEAMEELVLPKLIPVGTINLGRLQRMADILADFGFAPKGTSLDGFVYDPDPTVKRALFVQVTVTIGIALIITLLLVVGYMRLTRRLNQEVQQRLAAEKKLENMAYYDSLTGLPNRRLLFDRLGQAIPQAQRRHTQLAVAYLDLDGFKEINDRYGHSVGDRFLMAVAQRLAGCLRSSDTLARMGGDEFVAILTDLAVPEEVDELTKRLIEVASDNYKIAGFTLHVSASIGITYFPQKYEVDADALIRQADEAMYVAKSSGKNCCQKYTAQTAPEPDEV